MSKGLVGFLAVAWMVPGLSGCGGAPSARGVSGPKTIPAGAYSIYSAGYEAGANNANEKLELLTLPEMRAGVPWAAEQWELYMQGIRDRGAGLPKRFACEGGEVAEK